MSAGGAAAQNGLSRKVCTALTLMSRNMPPSVSAAVCLLTQHWISMQEWHPRLYTHAKGHTCDHAAIRWHCSRWCAACMAWRQGCTACCPTLPSPRAARPPLMMGSASSSMVRYGLMHCRLVPWGLQRHGVGLACQAVWEMLSAWASHSLQTWQWYRSTLHLVWCVWCVETAQQCVWHSGCLKRMCFGNCSSNCMVPKHVSCCHWGAVVTLHTRYLPPPASRLPPCSVHSAFGLEPQCTTSELALWVDHGAVRRAAHRQG